MLPQVTEFDIKLAHLKFVGCVNPHFWRWNLSKLITLWENKMQLKISNVQISCQILSLVAARAYVIMLLHWTSSQSPPTVVPSRNGKIGNVYNDFLPLNQATFKVNVPYRNNFLGDHLHIRSTTESVFHGKWGMEKEVGKKGWLISCWLSSDRRRRRKELLPPHRAGISLYRDDFVPGV